MDYEKLYKDAIERAKKIDIDDAYASQGTIAKTIFPELAESDDDKIREDIIGGLMWQRDNLKSEGPHDNNLILPGFCFTVGEHLAYLEKQKEQKPFSKFRSGDWVVYDGPLGHAILQVKDVIDGRYTFVDNVSTLLVEDSDKFLRPLTPKDVEKPAECLKAERDCWYVCIKDFYAGGKKQCSVGDLVQAKGGMYMMGMEDISEWFRRAYYEDVRDAFGPNTDTNIPEQKPAEWSEEDRNKVAKYLHERDGGMLWSRAKDITDDILDILRPSWKPSEEQIRTLDIVISDYRHACTKGSDKKAETLKPLLEQLEKL